jgi:hypothetical protein
MPYQYASQSLIRWIYWIANYSITLEWIIETIQSVQTKDYVMKNFKF